MTFQVLSGKFPCRNCDRAGADRAAAGDVVRGVANDVDFFGLEIDRMFFARPPLRKRSELIPIVVIIRERPKFEKIPKPVMS